MFRGLLSLIHGDNEARENPYASPRGLSADDPQNQPKHEPQNVTPQLTRDEQVRLEMFIDIFRSVSSRISKEGGELTVSQIIWERIQYVDGRFEQVITANRHLLIELMNDLPREAAWLARDEFDDNLHPGMRMMYADILHKLDNIGGANEQYKRALQLVMIGHHDIIE